MPGAPGSCAEAGVNALEYLVALMANRSAVFAHPERWLPWNYAETLADLSEVLGLPR